MLSRLRSGRPAALDKSTERSHSPSSHRRWFRPQSMDGCRAALAWRPCVTSPLNGPANTSGLDWPHKMSGFKQAAPGPEFFGPETKPKFRRLSPARDQIPKIICRTGRANAGFSRDGSVTKDSGNCVVETRGLKLRARHAVVSNQPL